MSIIDVTKMWSKTGGSSTSSKLDIYDQTWAISEGYMVLCEIGDNIVDVWNANAFGLPTHGDQHESGINAFVESISPTPIGPICWQVVIGYQGQTLDPGTVDVEWTDSTSTEPIDRDYAGAAIVTANGEAVDGLSMDVSDQICVIRRKFLTIDTPSIGLYRRATNSDTFLGWPPGTARLIGFSAKNQFKRNMPVEQWDVTARIQFREPYVNTTPAQAWYKRWRHEGLLVRVGTKIRRALDGLGQEVTKPVLLKVDGTQETDPNAAVFNHTQVYGTLPYSGLGLL